MLNGRENTQLSPAEAAQWIGWMQANKVRNPRGPVMKRDLFATIAVTKDIRQWKETAQHQLRLSPAQTTALGTRIAVLRLLVDTAIDEQGFP